MKNLHKNIIVSSLIAVSAVASVSATNFTDVSSNSWYHSYVTEMADAGYINGKTETTYAPDEELTLAQFSTMLTKAFYGETLAEELGENYTNWWEPYLQTLYTRTTDVNTSALSYYDKTNDWSEFPNVSVSRYDVAKILYNLLLDRDIELISEDLIGDYVNSVSDTIPTSNKTSIANCFHYGLLKGHSNGTFSGSNGLTRAEGAVILHTLVNSDIISEESFMDYEIPQSNENTQSNSTTTETVKPTTTYSMPADTNGDGEISISEMQVVFDYFRTTHPQGTRWTNDNYYGPYQGGVYNGGYGCAGFAFMVTDAIFGNAPMYTVSIDEIQVGDIWHTGTHFGTVMGIENGKYINVEGNVNSSVYWDLERTLSDVITVYSRHPQ